MKFPLMETPPQPKAGWPLYLTGAGRAEVVPEAGQCVNWLRAQGFDVLRVEATRRNPRITVRAGPLCDALEGAVRRYERILHNGSRTERRYWVAVRFGCEVRWTEDEKLLSGHPSEVAE